jgi:hypothetical protein
MIQALRHTPPSLLMDLDDNGPSLALRHGSMARWSRPLGTEGHVYRLPTPGRYRSVARRVEPPAFCGSGQWLRRLPYFPALPA